MINVAWGKKVDDDFLAAAARACLRLGWPLETHLSWLMGCIAFESAGTFSPAVRNKLSGATGLIQFMPSTAKSLGTTTEALAKMSAPGQFEYVEKYFKPYAARIKSLEDMYLAILMPKFVGSAAGVPVFRRGTVAYDQNKGFDKDGDGVITVLEVTALVRQRWQDGLAAGNARPI